MYINHMLWTLYSPPYRAFFFFTFLRGDGQINIFFVPLQTIKFFLFVFFLMIVIINLDIQFKK